MKQHEELKQKSKCHILSWGVNFSLNVKISLHVTLAGNIILISLVA